MSTPENPQASPEFLVSPEGLQAVIDCIAKLQKEIQEVNALDRNLVRLAGSSTRSMIEYRREKNSIQLEALLPALQKICPQAEGYWEQAAADRQPEVEGTGWSNEALRQAIDGNEGPM